MKIKPTSDFVFLSIEEKKDKGGIIAPDITKGNQPIGVVEAVGPDVRVIKIGDRVIFNAFILKEMIVENNKVHILKEKDIFGCLK
uniref:Putative chaperonin n=1 Tax=viral metagenome TaxID=1070528 RepID=A0A6M3IM36_9ZZZZ